MVKVLFYCQERIVIIKINAQQRLEQTNTSEIAIPTKNLPKTEATNTYKKTYQIPEPTNTYQKAETNQYLPEPILTKYLNLPISTNGQKLLLGPTTKGPLVG